MSNKRKPRKKHSAESRAQRRLNRAYVWRWESEYDFKNKFESFHVYVKEDIFRGYFEAKEASLKNAALRIRMNWFLCVRALFKNDDYQWSDYRTANLGELGLKSILGMTPEYNLYRNEILATQKYSHLVDVGFIAFAYNKKPLLPDNYQEMHEPEIYTDERQMLFRFADNETNKEVAA